jgi:hypothetical protein
MCLPLHRVLPLRISTRPQLVQTLHLDCLDHGQNLQLQLSGTGILKKKKKKKHNS